VTIFAIPIALAPATTAILSSVTQDLPGAAVPEVIRQDPSFDWRTLTEADFEADFRESQRKFNDVIGTDDDNIQRFRKRGGKMIIWHGEADQLIFPRGTMNYYQRLLNGNGGVKHVEDFARLFMAPGVGHCAGGAGPNPVGVFEAVVNWVENGVAPDKIMASRAVNGGGVGSADAAANFVCVDGEHNPRDFRITGPGSN
jgi:pimeloyl-ACP methyl ester carboxylesterase